ncbi:MAG: hypothetical protein ACRELU_11260 [Gemmatimonadota bacterium]
MPIAHRPGHGRVARLPGHYGIQMESETRYLGSLERATGLTLEPGRLTVRAGDEAGGTTTLVFAPLEGP